MNDSATRETTAPPKEQSLLARLVPVALTIVIFGVIFWRIPFEAFWQAVSGARLPPFFAVMGSFSLCFFLADSAVLTALIRWFHGPIRYRELLPVRASTYVVAIINTQLAQAALALYLNRRFRTPLGEITSTVVLLILLEATNLIFFATVGSAAFPGGTPAVFFVLPVLLALIWLTVVGIARGRLGALGRRFGGNVLLSRSAGCVCANPWPSYLKGSVFFLSLLVHARALTFFGIEIPVLPLLAFLPIVYLVAALPVTVAHLGTSQAAWIFFFGGYAAEADLLAYSLAAHLTFMLANGSFGLIFLPRVYADLFSRRPADTRS